MNTFHPFPKLPPELRIKIWKEYFPKARRVVNICYDERQDRFFSFNADVPTMLQISHETRDLGLQRYTLCFGTQSHSATIIFDFEHDVLLFDDWLANSRSKSCRSSAFKEEDQLLPITHMGGNELVSIKNVAINSSFFDYRLDWAKWDNVTFVLQPILEYFSALENLLLVAEDVDPYAKGLVQFIIPQRHVCPGFCVICLGKFNFECYLKAQKEKFDEGWEVPKVWTMAAIRGWQRSRMGVYELDSRIPYEPTGRNRGQLQNGAPNLLSNPVHPYGAMAAGAATFHPVYFSPRVLRPGTVAGTLGADEDYVFPFDTPDQLQDCVDAEILGDIDEDEVKDLVADEDDYKKMHILSGLDPYGVRQTHSGAKTEKFRRCKGR